MKKRDKLSVLVVHDHRAGHLNPSLGVCDAIATDFELTIHQLHSPKMNKNTISLFKFASRLPFLYKSISKIFFKLPQTSNQKYDFIVCSGMPNLIYSAFLSQVTKTPLLYAGDTRKFNPELITATITALEQDNISTTQIILPTPPVKAAYSHLKYQNPESDTALLILGGPTNQFPFELNEFDLIIDKFIECCQKNNLRPIITNSRRTPDLQSKFDSIASLHNLELHLYDTATAKSLAENLARSRYVFLTEDSTSMLAEAIQSGRFVASIYTSKCDLTQLNQKYLNNQLFTRQNLYDSFGLPDTRNLDLLSSNQIKNFIQNFLGSNK